MAHDNVAIAESGLTAEQLKLLHYLGDMAQELSDMAKASGFSRISNLLDETVIEAKALC